MEPRSTRLAVIHALFVTALALAAAPAFGGKLSNQDKERICAAIEILKKFEECCPEESAEGFKPEITVSACLEKIKEAGNICPSSDLGDDVAGRKTLDDKSADCTDEDKILVATENIVSKKNAKFILLLIVLYHEATHALQDLSKFETSDYKDKVTAPLEIQAWQNQQFVAKKMKKVLQTIYDNKKEKKAPGDGLTDCEKELAACWLDEKLKRSDIGPLLRKACSIDTMSEAQIKELKDWLEKECPKEKPATGSPRESEGRSKKEKKGQGPKLVLTGPSESRVLVIEEVPDPLESEPNDSIADADPVPCGGYVLGDVEPPGDADWFCFAVDALSVVTVDVGAGDADSTLALYDGAGVLVEFDDDDGPALSSSIGRSLAPGTYYAEVRGFGDDGTMAYDLAIDCRPVAAATESEPNDGLASADSAACDTLVQGAIGAPGDADFFRVVLPAATRFRAEVLCGPGDSTLALLDAAGATIELDDDDGPERCSYLSRDLGPGTYFLEVREFGGDAAMPYELAIVCPADADEALIVETRLDTGLEQIFGLHVHTDLANVERLYVSGHRGGSGVIQIWTDTTDAIPDAFQLREEIDSSLVTNAPSGLVPFGPEGAGGLLLWDEIAGQLFALVDTNGDGAPDSLDPTPRYGLPVPAAPYVRLSPAGPDEFVLERFAIGTMSADEISITVRDIDRNGFFDSFFDVFWEARPSQDPRLRPSSSLDPMDGFTAWSGAGVPGHMLHPWQTDGADGLVAPLGPPVSAGPDGRAEFLLDAPLLAGTFVQILDLNNGEFSEAYAVLPPTAVVYHAIGNAGPGTGGTSVFQRGVLLDTLGVTGVLVGDVPALSFEVGPAGVAYVTPPNAPVPGDGVTDRALHVDVQLVYDDGTGPRTLEAQPFAYLDPILAPDYACRTGNVNAAAGPVADVLFANGTAGIGAARQVFVAPDTPFTLSMQAPPSRPLGPSRFAAYATAGAPSPSRVRSLPFGLGEMCLPTPLSGGGAPLPKAIWNNIGKPARLGAATLPSAPAPSVLFTRPGGLGRRVTFTVQGLILDSASLQGQAAVTNAVVVISE